MNKFLFLVLSLPLFVSAQGHRPSKNYTSLDFVVGTRAFHQNFNGQLNTIDNINLLKPLEMAGIGVTAMMVMSRAREWPAQILYLRVIPQPITINDTIQATISGGLYSMPCFGMDLFSRSKWFGMLLDLGFNTGQLKIYGNDLVRQRNPFFSPNLSVLTQVKMGPIVFSVRGDYEYDISSPRWKKRWFAAKNKMSLPHLRQSGITVLVALGIVIPS